MLGYTFSEGITVSIIEDHSVTCFVRPVGDGETDCDEYSPLDELTDENFPTSSVDGDYNDLIDEVGRAKVE